MVFLDYGNLLPPIGRFGLSGPRIVADLGLKAMNKMGYTAMNLGEDDFSLGAAFLKKAVSTADFPVITSNLIYRDSLLPFGEKYVVRDVGGIRVGIIGIMPTDSFAKMMDQQAVSNLEIIPPSDALKDLLPEVREKADLVILLSQCGLEVTSLLVSNTISKLDGIDLVISSTGGRSHLTAGTAGTPVVTIGRRGKQLGVVKLRVADTGAVEVKKRELINLNESVALDGEIVAITGNDNRETIGERKKVLAETERKRMEREIEELQKLSPQEYVEMLKRKNSSTSENTP